MSVRLPGAETVSGPQSLRPSAPAPVADVSAIARGAANLAGSVGRVVREEQERRNVIDFAAADAYMLRESLNMQNQFEADSDYATFGDRAERGSQSILANAGEMIRDPRARQQWVASNETTRIRQVDAIGDIARARANEAERVRLESTLGEYGDLISDPTVPASIRDSARQSLSATIDVGLQEGLLTPSEHARLNAQFVDGSEERLAINTADDMIRNGQWQDVATGLGVGPDPADPVNDRRNSVRLPVVAADGINVLDVDPIVLNRYEQLQGAFGQQMTIISGARTDGRNAEVGGASGSQHLEENGNKAIDIDVSNMPREQRVALIEMASAMGFNGIGVYNNSLHLDIGSRRAWGPSHGRGSVPAWAEDAIARHENGSITQTPTGTGRNVDPRFASLTYEQRSNLFDRAKQEGDKLNMQTRAAIETTATNAPVAISNTGQYTGYMPTANDFVAAYGVQDGLQRYEAFDASVSVAEDTFSMRTMTADEITALVEHATPTSSGDDAALETRTYEHLSQAAKATLEARDADPAGYVQQVYPAVSEAWANINDSDPATFANAVNVTAMAQEELGMPPTLLPKAMAENVATVFNDANRPESERIGALTNIVLATPDQQQQQAIYDQLVEAGVSEQTRPAMEALGRGDDGAAQRLMAAALAPPETINKVLPNDIKPAQVDDEIQNIVFDTGAIGDIKYDLTYGSTENLLAAQADMALMANSVKLRMLDGTAGGNLQRAIDMTVKDMFGDVTPVLGAGSGGGAGLKILLPSSADQQSYRAGFNELLADVGVALTEDLNRDFGDVPADGAQLAIKDAGVTNYVEQTLAAGYFTNAGDGVFKFIDPNSGSAVSGPTGEPLLFSTQEVLAAGAEAAGGATAAGNRFGASIIRPEGVR